MIILPSQRQQSQSVRPKRSQSALNDQVELDAKAYRYVMSLSNDNINALMRSHRDCLGDIDPPPRIKISRQEQQAMAQQVDKIYFKFQEKLLREPLARNAQVRRGYSQFLQQYNEHQNQQSEAGWRCGVSQLDSSIIQNHFITNSQIKRNGNFFSASATPKRPTSSKLSSNMAMLNQAINGFNSTTLAQTYKMKTISAHANEDPETTRTQKGKCLIIALQKPPMREELSRGKRVMSSKPKDISATKRYSHKEDWEGFDFNGNEILISEKRQRQRQSVEMDSKQGEKPFQNVKACSKRILGLRYSQRKSIDQIERMQIQNRIMMVNSVLSVNLPRSQGYRPKSRCWQNYFN